MGPAPGFLAQAAGFFAEQGVRIPAVMTDKALNYQRSDAFAERSLDVD